MDPTKTTLLVTSQMGTYLLLVSSQQAQLTVRLRRNSRITSFIPHKILLFTTLTSTSTVKITAIRRRHLMSKRTTRRQPFKTKNFRQALNFALDRTSYSAQVNGKDGASKNSTYPSSSTDICASRRERLRYSR